MSQITLLHLTYRDITVIRSNNEIRTSEDVEDFLRGLTVLGTGGGGRPEAGRSALLPLVDKGLTLGWRSLGSVADDDLFCSLSGLGSIAPTQPMEAEARVGAGYPATMADEQPMVRALRALERLRGARVAGVYPIELGASNSATPLAAAIAAGVDMIDCDCAGRAIPEMSQSTVARSGVSFAPAVFADHWGSLLAVAECHSTLLGERLGKAISTVTKAADMRAQCARAAFVVDGRTLKKIALPGGLSRALRLGRTIAAARQAGKDPVEATAIELSGRIVHRGVLVSKNWETRDGFMIGDLSIKTATGSEARVWLKNENHIVWLEGAALYTSPDLICIVDAHSGEPYTNTNIQEGADVAIVVAPAPPQLRSAAAVEMLGPKHYGFDIPYIPMEDRR